MKGLLIAPTRHLRAAMAAILLSGATSALALNTATITSSVLSVDCLEYRVVGICYWLYCTWTSCSVRTSIKVRHYVPDALVAMSSASSPAARAMPARVPAQPSCPTC